MIDFQEIAKTSELYNFHSHTQFCDGHAPMAEFAQKAAEAGFTHYGFSPHSPVPIDSPCNIAKEDVACYFAEFNRLKEQYSGKVSLLASMEIDYLGDFWGPSNEYFGTLPLDYRIGSVHFVPCGDTMVDTDGRFESFKVKMATYFDNDIVGVVNTFYDQTLKMITAGGFDIIGHFDKIGLNASYFAPGIEDEPWYGKRVAEVMEAIKECGATAEINTKSLFQHHRLFPHERYFQQIKKMGIPVVFNSDAHYPDLINAGRREAMGIYNNL